MAERPNVFVSGKKAARFVLRGQVGSDKLELRFDSPVILSEMDVSETGRPVAEAAKGIKSENWQTCGDGSWIPFFIIQ